MSIGHSTKTFLKDLLRPLYRYALGLDGAFNSPGNKAFFFPVNYFYAFKNPMVPFRQVSAYQTLKKIIDWNNSEKKKDNLKEICEEQIFDYLNK